MANETILVVEDETLVGEELREDLERSGYRVPELVSRAEDVADAVSRCNPSLILMDIRLGGGRDGIAAMEELRRSRDIPVIFLTAYSDPETLERAAAVEPAAYLLKPFNENELNANVAMALCRRRGKPYESGRLGPVLEALALPAFHVDALGTILYANEPGVSLLRVPSREALRGARLESYLMEFEVPDPKRRFVVTGDGARRLVHSRFESLNALGGRAGDTLAILDPYGSNERRHLELSAQAAAEAMQDLLPRFDAAGTDYSVAGFLVPCPSGSGDLYDVFQIDSDFFAFHALDVMGHGVLPSLFAYSLHSVVRMMATSRQGGRLPTPSGLMADLNDRYAGSGAPTPFFSMIYGMVERSTGHYWVVRAGHPPLVHIPACGAAYALDRKGGSALGAFPGVSFEEDEGYLSPGDRLAICSDGLLDSFGEGDLIPGIDEFIRFCDVGRVLDTRALAAAIKSRFIRRSERSSGDRGQDDASFLYIERL